VNVMRKWNQNSNRIALHYCDKKFLIFAFFCIAFASHYHPWCTSVEALIKLKKCQYSSWTNRILNYWPWSLIWVNGILSQFCVGSGDNSWMFLLCLSLNYGISIRE
jgi:hypothetical protein